MPELPEVETVCRGLEQILIGQKFTKVQQFSLSLVSNYQNMPHPYITPLVFSFVRF